MTVAAALARGRKLLEQGRIADPRLTAEVLLCRALEREKVFLYAHPEYELDEAEVLHFDRYLRERLSGKPTQYITGRQEFFGRDFLVTADVMIPRPETEHVVEAALDVGRGARHIVDVGTGSGAIAVTLGLETGTEVIATDVSAAALAVAAKNAGDLEAKVSFLRCDLCSALAAGSVELVVSNPPYVPNGELESLQREVRDFEPRAALCGGDEGLDYYRRLTQEGRRLLRPGGWLVLELGIRQLGAVREMLEGPWNSVRSIDDLAGLPRVLVAQYEP